MIKDHPHPGEVLREDVLEPLGLSVTEAAKRLSLSRVTLSRVLHGRAGISPDLAIRLERAGVSTARFWLGLQAGYGLSRALEREQPSVMALRSEEHTSELQSLMRISYAVFCLNKNKIETNLNTAPTAQLSTRLHSPKNNSPL